ncbi:LysR family transcriptional regulator [Rhodococcus sp. KBS0724]|uniref:LysR family transcriptional regulator n=1 Tax=Rhodococcus sp. KBS0724 TaxID=1179674 RepID=UPI00110E562C|nr:LysR family transcriptional regulator [Rhodococcus sp. KBS0724]TSD48048.1 LysR family transcriptional regulator [Rhodococcus sp. KBS0724]
MYDIRRLILLHDLAELTTMTAVSERHGITTSAVSQQMRLLEEEVGKVLTRRVGRVLRLTHAGRVLVDHTARIVAALEEAESAVAATGEAATGVLTIATFTSALTRLAIPAATWLRGDHQGLRVRLVDAVPVDSVSAVRQLEVDLAITYTYSFQTSVLPVGLESEFLFTDPLVLLAPAPLQERVRRHGFIAVADADWIAAPDGAPSVASIAFSCRQSGFAPRIEHRSGSFSAMAEMVDHGFGVTVLPEMAVPESAKHLIACPIANGAREIGVTYRRASLERPAVAAAIRALRTAAVPLHLAS